MPKLRDISFTHLLTRTQGKTKLHYVVKDSQFAVDLPSEFDPMRKIRVYGATEKEALSAFHEFMNSTFQLGDHLEKVIQYSLKVSCSAPHPEETNWTDKWGKMEKCMVRSYASSGGDSGVSIREAASKRKISFDYHVTLRDQRKEAEYFNKYFKVSSSNVDGFCRDGNTLRDSVEIPYSVEAEDFFKNLCSGIEALAHEAVNWFLQDNVKELIGSGIGSLRIGERKND